MVISGFKFRLPDYVTRRETRYENRSPYGNPAQMIRCSSSHQRWHGRSDRSGGSVEYSSKEMVVATTGLINAKGLNSTTVSHANKAGLMYSASRCRWFMRPVLAPGAPYRKQSRKQREGADRHAWINLGFVRRPPEGHSMSGGANAERKIQHQRGISKKILRHMQILSGGIQGVWNPRRPAKPNQAAQCCPVCLLRYKKAARPSSPVPSNKNEDGSGDT